MTKKDARQQISREAAMLAIDWKGRFAAELQVAAMRAAQGVGVITVEHYRQALPKAIEALIQNIEIATAPLNARPEAIRRTAA